MGFLFDWMSTFGVAVVSPDPSLPKEEEAVVRFLSAEGTVRFFFASNVSIQILVKRENQTE